jgi:hypothetical protein
MQMRRMAALEKKKEYNNAFKCVTVVYAREKGKDDGLSARTVEGWRRNPGGSHTCMPQQSSSVAKHQQLW